MGLDQKYFFFYFYGGGLALSFLSEVFSGVCSLVFSTCPGDLCLLYPLVPPVCSGDFCLFLSVGVGEKTNLLGMVVDSCFCSLNWYCRTPFALSINL